LIQGQSLNGKHQNSNAQIDFEASIDGGKITPASTAVSVKL
jgi:hypothetical protein